MVTHVRDGDTIEVRGVAVRIANLDCAERGTVRGERATALMRQIASGETASCALEGRRSYDRQVGVCGGSRITWVSESFGIGFLRFRAEPDHPGAATTASPGTGRWRSGGSVPETHIARTL